MRVLIITLLTGYLILFFAFLFHHFIRLKKVKRLPEKQSDRDDSTGEVLIELVKVKKQFDQPILRDINFKVYRGETLGILGKSGTGKSVLLKLASGLLKPDEGQIFFKEKDITLMNETELLDIRKHLSYVFQSGAFFDFSTVRENIAYPLREQGVTDEEKIRQRVDYLLDAVELHGMGNLESDDLSAGSKKQVAIARAMANNPEAILYDEPTNGVDPITGKSLSRLIQKLDQQENLTSIVVTHDLKCLKIVAERVILLKDGYVYFEGNYQEFYTSPDPFIQAFVAGKRFEERQEEMTE